ncbi:YolD-like family protein [Brevibacillus sp. TJ4]|uniref:YolD-like family protein n=1 Tax=Brevibacillus sp. TJ4 TaxID=3234853 RepID=UPI0037D18EBB
MPSKKDDLFASMRFVLPEQKEAYLEYVADLQLIPQPLLEADEIEEIQQTIRESIHFGQAIRVSWWRRTKGELGVAEEAWGWVRKIDPYQGQIKLVHDEEVHWIKLDQLLRVQTV